MRIRRVTAHAFGHLHEQTLTFADGLTVIYGPNESGKSTWHAALLAALCGRWPSRARDEPGIERRRPWSGPQWRVSAEVVLADGRRVELWHDLDARYGYAKDLDRVADYSGEITGPGRGEVPDATRWLGLDRRAFVATACVRQSHLVLAADDAAGVRGYVERAASTALADETVAAALERIDSFHREHVGTERARNRPLPVAQRRRADAEAAVRAARAGQAELEESQAATRRLRAAAQAALARLRGREAALARVEAQRLRARAVQARELAELIAREDAPVTSAAAGSRAVTTTLTPATEVAAAVEAWRATVAVAPPAPPPTPVVPPPRDEVGARPEQAGVAREEAGVPVPVSLAEPDLTPPVSSGETGDGLAVAGSAVVSSGGGDGLTAASGGASEGPASGSPAEPVVAPAAEASGPGRRLSAPLFVAAGLLLVLAAVLVGAGATSVGVAVGLVGLVAGAVGLFHRGRESALATASRAVAPPAPVVAPTGAPTVTAPTPLVTPTQVTTVGESATTTGVTTTQAPTPTEPTSGPTTLTEQTPGPAALTTVDEVVLVAQQRWREWEERLGRAEHRVLTLAGELGLSGNSAADAVRDLEAWLAAERDRQAARERAAAQRARLEALLDGASLADLEAAARRAEERAEAAQREADEAAREAERAAREAGPADPAGGRAPEATPESTVEEDVEALRRQYQESDRRATLAEQALATRRKELPSVAEAEEELAAAEAECRRLESLHEVLTRTRTFLARAQERVHRDIAPQLAAAVGRDLAAVTAGRYTEAVVDTSTLAVQVRGTGGPLRNVEQLSLGTVEQVYLLVRVALAERLVRPGESCPLLLDDVTVHADQDRTRRVLDTLLAVAERHQVVLFTQQEQVRQWAHATLTGPKHAVHELTTLAPT
jgi:recombinational DNA repair ATPase RecF